jgi:hypothetical protein
MGGYGGLTEGGYADLLHNSSKARHGLDIRQYGAEVEFATGDYVIVQGGPEARGKSGEWWGKQGWKKTYKSMCVCSSD